MNEHIEMIKELWDGIGNNDRFIKFIERHNKRYEDCEEMQIRYTIDDFDNIDFGNERAMFIARMIIEDMEEEKKPTYEELEAQAAASEEPLHIHLYECGHIWKKENGQAPEDCPVCQREAQAAVMRRAISDFVTAYNTTLHYFNADPTKIFEIGTAFNSAEQALSSTAGRELLEKIEQLDKALELACESQIDCPNTDHQAPWDCNKRSCDDVVQCWKDYFLSKAGQFNDKEA